MSEKIKIIIGGVEGFILDSAQVDFSGKSHFVPCLRASLAKAYEFLKFTYKENQPEAYFFAVSTLRGITEDLIVLSYISSKMNAQNRELILSLLQKVEVIERMNDQSRFFDKYRSFQPILVTPVEWPARSVLVEEIKSIFINCGWFERQLNDRGLPSVAALAREVAPGVADVLYNFIYRLSSSAVHFSPQTLLRLGWGDKEGRATFSVVHLSSYYQKFCRVYSALLFTFYFEMFDNYIKPPDDVRDLILELREQILLDNRWPEMITFEEMNVPVPQVYHEQPILSFLQFQSFTEKYKHGFMPQTTRPDRKGVSVGDNNQKRRK